MLSHTLVTGFAALMAAAPAGPRVEPPVLVRSGHYELRGTIAVDRARDFAALLEAARGRLDRLLGRPLAPGQRLRVNLYRDGRERDRALGATVQGGGIFLYENQQCYLAVQPTRYFTRHLMLHEATHQFVCAAFARRVDFLPAWLAEGLAEYVAHHNWDGRDLEIGLWDVVTLPGNDWLAQAKAKLDAGQWTIDRILRSDGTDRAGPWALTHVLMTHHRARLHQYIARCLAEGGAEEPTAKQGVAWFDAVFGADRGRLGAELHRFVRGSARRWEVLWPDWERRGRVLVGHGGELAAMVLDQSCADLSGRVASVRVTCDWSRTTPGLLVGYKSDTDFHVVEIFQGRLVHFGRRWRGHWAGVRTQRLADRVASRDAVRLRVWHQAGHLHVEIGAPGRAASGPVSGGRQSGAIGAVQVVRIPMPGAAFVGRWGLRAYRGDARFEAPVVGPVTTRATRPKAVGRP